jgi:CxxC motif-containing protein (DUF1111 family)
MNRQVKLITTSIFTISIVCLLSLSGARSQGAAKFGDPLPGLTAEQMKLFLEGKEDFVSIEEPEDGLGPLFNARGCGECHAMPAVGGSSTAKEVRAGRVDPDGTYYDLPGGSLYQIFSISAECQEVIPSEANVIAFREVQPLFGLGLIEAIPDETILAAADPDDDDHDGISGRAAIVFDPASKSMRVGRFGWKDQQASLLAFSGDAYTNEMSITNDIAPTENAPNGDETRMASCDQLADPESTADPVTGRRAIDNFTNFMRFLGPPPRGPMTEAVRRGDAVFNSIGCAKCHTPTMQTGPSSIAALDRKIVPLYSDLLLHNIGTGDGIPQADAGKDQIRTPPLWGLRASRPFLHDGSAGTLERAILRHGGEATLVTLRFTLLRSSQRDDLLAFLESL